MKKELIHTRKISVNCCETDGSILLNSCYMWREGSPFEEKIRRRRMEAKGRRQ